MAYDAGNDVRLKAGSYLDIPDSMAEAMEVAFGEEWQLRMGGVLPENGREMLQMVFAAIAQGVVRHLVDNREAFKISVTVTQAHDDAAVTEAAASDFRLQASNEATVDVGDAWGGGGGQHDHEIGAGEVVVSQTSDWMVSEGSGTITDVAIDGTLYGGTP